MIIYISFFLHLVVILAEVRREERARGKHRIIVQKIFLSLKDMDIKMKHHSANYIVNKTNAY